MIFSVPKRPPGTDRRAIASIMADLDSLVDPINKGQLDGGNLAAFAVGSQRFKPQLVSLAGGGKVVAPGPSGPPYINPSSELLGKQLDVSCASTAFVLLVGALVFYTQFNSGISPTPSNANHTVTANLAFSEGQFGQALGATAREGWVVNPWTDSIDYPMSLVTGATLTPGTHNLFLRSTCTFSPAETNLRLAYYNLRAYALLFGATVL